MQRFIDALHTLEADQDTQVLATLVTDDADVLSIDGHGPRRGPEGMTELFTQYLGQFDRVATTFTRITENDTSAALEWSSDTVLSGGHPAVYTGTTVVEHDGTSITRFSTVYDSAALLGPQPHAQAVDDDDDEPSAARNAPQGDVTKDEVDPVVGRYGADSGFLPEADRAAATGRDR